MPGAGAGAGAAPLAGAGVLAGALPFGCAPGVSSAGGGFFTSPSTVSTGSAGAVVEVGGVADDGAGSGRADSLRSTFLSKSSSYRIVTSVPFWYCSQRSARPSPFLSRSIDSSDPEVSYFSQVSVFLLWSGRDVRWVYWWEWTHLC